MKKLLSFLYSRPFIVGLALLIQLVTLVLLVLRFNRYFSSFYAIGNLMAVIAVIRIVNGQKNPAYKIAWIILILAVPIFGGLFYMMFGNNRMNKTIRQKIYRIRQQMEEEQKKDQKRREVVLDCLEKDNLMAYRQSRYIDCDGSFPPFENTQVRYFSLGEKMWESMLEQLRLAKNFIFMEYFIIEEGFMWNTIVDILKEKVAEGVEVRVLYDDLGSLFTLPYKYHEKLRSFGIKANSFNPLRPSLEPIMNNRDHRKICVIDGKVGFNGGINIADEYINRKVKHGHWKDTGLLLEGEGVWNLTQMFLAMWDASTGDHSDMKLYHPSQYMKNLSASDGFVQPFGDSPLDDTLLSENAYINMIYHATRYVHIMTPYLIIDNEVLTAMRTAARSGVDITLITPHIADKRFVHTTTRAYYKDLIEAGVKIYEYTPGFIHAKSFVSDDQYAIVGTINLDYRSLHLHFECGVWMYGSRCIEEIERDFQQTLSVSQPFTMEEVQKFSLATKLAQNLLKVIAPLM